MAEFSSTTGPSGSTGTTGMPGSSATAGSADTPGQSTPGFGSGIVDKVRERATAQLTSQKDRAFDGIGSVAQAVRQSTQQLRDQHHDTLAGYVEQAADQIDRLAQQLRGKDVGELLDDAQQLARRQPALFVGSAFAIGLLGARFLKSSTRHRDERYGAYGYAGGRGGRAERSDRFGDDHYGAMPSTGSNRDWRPGTETGSGQSSAQYGSGATRSSERSTSAPGISPPSNASTPVASGASYSSSSEPGLTPASGSGTGADRGTGPSGSSGSGATRGRSGGKGDSPSSGPTSTNRGRRSGADTERS